MSLFRSVGAVAAASGDGAIDWEAVSEVAKAGSSPGSIDLGPGEAEDYAADVGDARREIRAASGLAFDLPRTVEIQHRHHWIDANVATFREVMRPLEEREVALPEITRRVNTATMGAMLAFLSKHVLGQYDPGLLGTSEPALYFVRPNLQQVADELGVGYDRFRRWIAFHEVTHAAEFGAAPWLVPHLETRVERAVASLADGGVDRGALRELDTAMTAVEGYAEFVMDRAFDARYDDLREKVDARRRAGGPIAMLVRYLLGLGLKRRQYERGRAFFAAIVAERGVEGAGVVWDAPDNLPTSEEIDRPARWLARVD